MKVYKILLAVLVAGIMSSCGNQDVSFPDFDFTTVYFANQYPLRTLELGDDPQVDNSLDNEHKVKIMATMGGVYANNEDRIIDISVDESLCDGVSFVGGSEILPMPSNYYTLEANTIEIKAGEILGGVVVQFTDAFFNDPQSITNKYVIPLVMTGATNADSILSGKATVANANRMVSADWEIAPKDYVLYAVKYVNKWDANYLRRGVDEISDGAGTVTDIRRSEFVEYDEVVSISTNSLTECTLPISIYEEDNLTTRATVDLKLTFDSDNNCTVSGSTSAYSISGTGRFVTDGEKNSMGGVDRDGLYLDYTVELIDLGYTYTTKDTLVSRDRGIVPEYYNITVE
ncbi:DUF5627 domain-containing protein [uncultured Draconibacterium sp.]|uniref:DUF5627 domain-containing protein n=1 Tax=uncultured Draconibacterium sp. TaxID=1573823 RepID=UPI0025FB02CF|nr:DUF5627 domain-containing protein [uncultured Draconibacterium sp.]